MWRNFGCEGFEFHGEKLAESAGDRELAHSPSMATREGEGEQGEAQEGARQVASSGEGRGRLGDATDGRETGIGLHDGKDTAMRASGGVGAITATCSTGKRGWVYDRWGPRVRKFLYLNPNFWIVTILLWLHQLSLIA